MEKINIFVVSHKPVNLADYPGRKIIYVGKKHNQIPDFVTTFTDNTGDNIAELNPYYCELTALYWIWKNAPKSEYIGIEHYSRNFTWNFIKPASLNFLYKKAKKCDIVHIYSPRHIKTSLDVWLEHEGKYLDKILRDAILKLVPNFYDYWVESLNKHYLYYCNMFICKWEIFDKYMHFIFNILNECYKNIQSLPPEQQARSIGFMSERLLNGFIKQNNYKTRSCWIKARKH